MRVQCNRSETVRLAPGNFFTQHEGVTNFGSNGLTLELTLCLLPVGGWLQRTLSLPCELWFSWRTQSVQKRHRGRGYKTACVRRSLLTHLGVLLSVRITNSSARIGFSSARHHGKWSSYGRSGLLWKFPWNTRFIPEYSPIIPELCMIFSCLLFLQLCQHNPPNPTRKFNCEYSHVWLRVLECSFKVASILQFSTCEFRVESGQCIAGVCLLTLVFGTRVRYCEWYEWTILRVTLNL